MANQFFNGPAPQQAAFDKLNSKFTGEELISDLNNFKYDFKISRVDPTTLHLPEANLYGIAVCYGLPVLGWYTQIIMTTSNSRYFIRSIYGNTIENWQETAQRSKSVSVTAAAGSWSSATPPTQEILVASVTSSNNIVVGLASNAISAQIDAAAAGKLLCTAQGAGTITMTCYGTVPTENIPLSVLVLG